MIGPDFAEEYLRTYGLVHYGRYQKIKAFLDGNGDIAADFEPEVTHPVVTEALADADRFIADRRAALARYRK